MLCCFSWETPHNGAKDPPKPAAPIVWLFLHRKQAEAIQTHLIAHHMMIPLVAVEDAIPHPDAVFIAAVFFCQNVQQRPVGLEVKGAVDGSHQKILVAQLCHHAASRGMPFFRVLIKHIQVHL